jgi:hypothetical protein
MKTAHRPHPNFTVLASLLGLIVLCFIPTLLAGSMAAGGML